MPVAWAWGPNGDGSLGDGTTTSSSTPVQVSGLANVTAIAGGDDFSMAMESDGSVWTWGWNYYGELGNGQSANTTTPGKVAGLGTVVAIAAGFHQAFALQNDGTVWAWGLNDAGELGATSQDTCVVGSYSYPCSRTPIQVTGLGGVTAIGAGIYHALAVTSGGSVWAWGDNSEGELGNDTVATTGCACSTTPVQVVGAGGVGTLGGIVMVAAGAYHSLAVDSSGNVWSWGDNNSGQLGNGTASSGGGCECVPAPARVVGPDGGYLTGVVTTSPGAIAAGTFHSLAVKADGSVWAWGDNYDGELGNNTFTTTGCGCNPTPSPVVGPGGSGTFTGGTMVAAGDYTSFALKSDGTAWAWGENSAGELGNGTTTWEPSPVPVSGLGVASAVGQPEGANRGYAIATPPSCPLPAQPAPAGSAANPPFLDTATSAGMVDTLTGSFAYEHTDMAIPGRGPSPAFARAYNSDDTRAGPLGPGWTDSYNIHLSCPDDGTADVILDGPEGRSDRYTYANGAYTPPPAVYTTLVQHQDGTYTATQRDQTTWSFDAQGRLMAITDRYGNVSALTYTNGQLTSVSDPAGRGVLRFTYNSSGLLASVQDWLTPQRSVQFGYDSQSRLQTVTDRDGKVTTYGYDGTSSRLASITDANNHVAVAMTFDGQGRVQTQADALNNQTTFGYVTNQDGTQITTVTSPATSFDNTNPTVADTYDTNGRLIKRVSQVSASESYTEQYGYDANGDLTSMTDGRGNTTSLCYDVDYSGAALSPAVGNLTRVIAPAPTAGANVLVTLLKYDGKDNLLETIPPKGVTSGTSASCGTNFASGVNTTSATDYAYDSTAVFLDSVTQRFTDPDKGLQTATTAYQYTDANNPGAVTAVVPPLTGHTTSFTYYNATSNPTEAGMLQQVKDALGDATSYTYDAVGRRQTMTDPMINVWSYSYDNEDRLTQTQTPAVGGAPLTTQYQYDPVGNRTVVIDASGQVTQYRYDARDSLSEVDQSPLAWTDPNATPSPLYRTTYAYDNLGNLSRIDRATGDSANERATDYRYDGLDRLRTEIQYPSWPATTPTLTTSYAYDGDNNRTSMVDPLNQETDYGYDADSRLTAITYKAGATPNVTYGYDANGNRRSMGDGTGTTSYLYDELNRLTSVTQGDGQVIGYRYDTDGNRSELIYPGAHVVAYAYDAADRLQTVTDWASRVSTYGYYADGQVHTLTNVDGSTATYSYDPAQRLTEVSNQKAGGVTIDQHGYMLDPMGNPTQRQENLALVGGGDTNTTTLYSYDKLNELTLAGPQGSQATYCYDPVGNRVATAAGCSPTITYDKADRILQSGSTAYTVDADGDVTNRGGDTFAYDQANRMTLATVNGTAAGFGYDGDGLRMNQTSGGTTVGYAWDVNSSLPELLSDGTRYYIYGLDLLYSINPRGFSAPAAARPNATATTAPQAAAAPRAATAPKGTSTTTPDNLLTHVRVYHLDGLGSVRALTDENGTLTNTYSTDAFGANAGQVGLSQQPFGYAGEQTDTNGLVYLRARYYDPNSGRFMTRDPVAGSAGLPLSLNRYAYVTNDPTRQVDPSGMCSNQVCRISIVLGASGAAPDDCSQEGGSSDPACWSRSEDTSGSNSASATMGGGSGGSGYQGGQYGTLPKSPDWEVHHMPADSVSPLSRYKGPAIQMDPTDHANTGSYGRGAAQDAYRAAQKALIDAGRVRDAVAMDIQNVRSIAGSKYNQAIKQMLDYGKSIGFLDKLP